MQFGCISLKQRLLLDGNRRAHPIALKSSHPKRILVADETPSSRELLRVFLEHVMKRDGGCEVCEARDGVEAVAMARAIQPDLVLLNVELPRLDGYAAVREMRLDASLKNRSIVALTETPQTSDEERMHAAGFTGYITKPLVLQEFSWHLAELLPPDFVPQGK